MKKNTVRTAWFGVFTALALIFSYVETLIPFQIGIPGVKLGLAESDSCGGTVQDGCKGRPVAFGDTYRAVRIYFCQSVQYFIQSGRRTFKPCSDGGFEKKGIVQCFRSQHGRWLSFTMSVS